MGHAGNGKGHCDGIGAGLKRMLGLWAKKRTTIPTVKECVDYLWANTKPKPFCARYAHVTEYRFQLPPSQQLD